jgi:pyruvate dehydrogenase E2 component (dihydrolipoamide acetyltransferase)
VTQHVEIDVTELVWLLARMNKDKAPPERIPLKAFYLKAMAICVKEKERFRLRLADAGDAYLLLDGANIGLQLNTPDGFATPVLRDADKKTLQEINAEVLAFVERAKHSGIPYEERRNGAITLLDKSDCGVFSFTPIINQPEASILGTGAPIERLVLESGDLKKKHFMTLSLTYDHRIINGTESALFQNRIKGLLENPELLI